MKTPRTITFCVLAILACATTSRAQVGPEEAVKKILDTINQELEEIDKMLLESSKRDAVGDAAAPERIKRLIEETKGSQDRVVRGIDDLIKQLEQMSQQNSSGGGQSQDQQQQRSDEPVDDQQRSTRQDGEGPPRQQNSERPGAQQGQQQGQQQDQKPGQGDPQGQGQDPTGNQPDPKTGQNADGSARPDGATERVERAGGDARWGELPDYQLPVHLRGGHPSVPEKYRGFIEEYHKQNQRVRTNGRGGSTRRGQSNGSTGNGGGTRPGAGSGTGTTNGRGNRDD